MLTMAWDPLSVKQGLLPTNVIMRIRRDLENIHMQPLPGVFVVTDSEDISLVHALIAGPSDTPYEGGFFYFILRFPTTYPIKPPLAKLINTGQNTMRFNPNLYADGKVCLSILGTWTGPSWSPANTLSSVLLSIQSLLCQFPIRNEPGWENVDPTSSESIAYNAYLCHQTLRHAFIDYLDGRVPKIPEALSAVIQGSFVDLVETWEEICRDNWDKDGLKMIVPSFDSTKRKDKKFKYKELYAKLQALKKTLDVV